VNLTLLIQCFYLQKAVTQNVILFFYCQYHHLSFHAIFHVIQLPLEICPRKMCSLCHATFTLVYKGECLRARKALRCANFLKYFIPWSVFPCNNKTRLDFIFIPVYYSSYSLKIYGIYLMK